MHIQTYFKQFNSISSQQKLKIENIFSSLNQSRKSLSKLYQQHKQKYNSPINNINSSTNYNNLKDQPNYKYQSTNKYQSINKYTYHQTQSNNQNNINKQQCSNNYVLNNLNNQQLFKTINKDKSQQKINKLFKKSIPKSIQQFAFDDNLFHTLYQQSNLKLSHHRNSSINNQINPQQLRLSHRENNSINDKINPQKLSFKLNYVQNHKPIMKMKINNNLSNQSIKQNSKSINNKFINQTNNKCINQKNNRNKQDKQCQQIQLIKQQNDESSYINYLTQPKHTIALNTNNKISNIQKFIVKYEYTQTPRSANIKNRTRSNRISIKDTLINYNQKGNINKLIKQKTINRYSTLPVRKIKSSINHYHLTNNNQNNHQYNNNNQSNLNNLNNYHTNNYNTNNYNTNNQYNTNNTNSNNKNSPNNKNLTNNKSSPKNRYYTPQKIRQNIQFNRQIPDYVKNIMKPCKIQGIQLLTRPLTVGFKRTNKNYIDNNNTLSLIKQKTKIQQKTIIKQISGLQQRLETKQRLKIRQIRDDRIQWSVRVVKTARQTRKQRQNRLNKINIQNKLINSPNNKNNNNKLQNKQIQQQTKIIKLQPWNNNISNQQQLLQQQQILFNH